MKGLPKGLYAITAEPLSMGRDNITVVREMISGGTDIIQYREKENLTRKEKLSQCLQIRKMTADAGVFFIVDDEVDLAMAVEADGVHIGQDDFPLKTVRALARNMAVGLSTHNPAQAREAALLGADYIGVGPIFPTKTKIHPEGPVGLDYLDFVIQNIALPFVAIGGIKKRHIPELMWHGVTRICMVSAIVGAQDIASEVREIKTLMKNSVPKNIRLDF